MNEADQLFGLDRFTEGPAWNIDTSSASLRFQELGFYGLGFRVSKLPRTLNSKEGEIWRPQQLSTFLFGLVTTFRRTREGLNLLQALNLNHAMRA